MFVGASSKLLEKGSHEFEISLQCIKLVYSA